MLPMRGLLVPEARLAAPSLSLPSDCKKQNKKNTQVSTHVAEEAELVELPTETSVICSRGASLLISANDNWSIG